MSVLRLALRVWHGFVESEVWIPSIMVGAVVGSKTDDLDWGVVAAFVMIALLMPLQAILDHLEKDA